MTSSRHVPQDIFTTFKDLQDVFSVTLFRLPRRPENVFSRRIQDALQGVFVELVKTGRRRNYLASEPNYHTAKFFTENVKKKKMKKEMK